MRAILILAAAAIIVPTAGTAGDAAQSTAPVVIPTTADGDKIICKRRKEPEVGTHLRSRAKTCMRASDWKELEALTEDAKRRIQDRAPGTLDPNKQTMGGGGGLN